MLYRNTRISEYAAIAINNGYKESVMLHAGNNEVDISLHHWLLCLQPITYGIWLNKQANPDDFKNEPCTLVFYEKWTKGRSKKKLAVVSLSYFDCIEEEAGSLLLLRQQKCRVYHVPILECLLLYFRCYRKPGFSFLKFKSYVSAFSFPRKVRLVSFMDGNYYNIFPMDLVGSISNTPFYVLGLRHSNQTLTRIMKKGKLVVSEPPGSQKTAVYSLGNHHSATPPALAALPFKTVASAEFGFPVPEWVECYHELTIHRTIDLGSQMLLWATSQNDRSINNPAPHFYHIHFLLHLFQQRRGNAYALASGTNE